MALARGDPALSVSTLLCDGETTRERDFADLAGPDGLVVSYQFAFSAIATN